MKRILICSPVIYVFLVWVICTLIGLYLAKGD